MTAESAVSAVEVVTALGGASAAWPSELWAGSMRLVDALLRSYYGVYEFTDDPACVLRIGLGAARDPVTLSDGTQIRGGEIIGTLHFWNEQLPRYSSGGPNLYWACTIRDQVRHSLCALAEYIETNPDWREVRAFRGQAALSARLGIPQVQRVAARYGFERVPTKPSLLRRVHSVGESFVLWGLTRALNPAAALRQPFLRDHHELWISRRTLCMRYAGRPRDVPGAATRSRGS
jgi:hypothetical protein